MRGVFMKVCHTLKVSDPADPLSATVARTVITLALDGEVDRDALYQQTLNRL
jgi:hypothetical protein